MAERSGGSLGLLVLAAMAVGWGAWLVWFSIYDAGGRWWIGALGSVLALIGAQSFVAEAFAGRFLPVALFLGATGVILALVGGFQLLVAQ